jgi:hypothetical protein
MSYRQQLRRDREQLRRDQALDLLNRKLADPERSGVRVTSNADPVPLPGPGEARP